MQEDISCHICGSGFIHVKWQGEEYVLSREIGWLSHDEVYSNYHPVYHPCVNCSKQSLLCEIESIVMESIDRFITVGLYYSKEEFKSITNLLSQWILKLKKDEKYADPLGCALAEVINRYWLKALTNECKGIIIIPVPKHPDEGTYNQALKLAEALLKRLKINNISVRLEPNLVNKKLPTKAGERRSKCGNICQNDVKCFAKCNFNEVLSALEVSRRYITTGDTCVIVVDDVKTTGATVGAMAKLLKDKGVHKVYVATLARDAIRRELLKCVAAHFWERHDYFTRGHEK